MKLVHFPFMPWPSLPYFCSKNLIPTKTGGYDGQIVIGGGIWRVKKKSVSNTIYVILIRAPR